jgi:hypothetical protein
MTDTRETALVKEVRAAFDAAGPWPWEWTPNLMGRFIKQGDHSQSVDGGTWERTPEGHLVERLHEWLPALCDAVERLEAAVEHLKLDLANQETAHSDTSTRLFELIGAAKAEAEQVDRLTAENTELKARVEKMREALETANTMAELLRAYKGCNQKCPARDMVELYRLRSDAALTPPEPDDLKSGCALCRHALVRSGHIPSNVPCGDCTQNEAVAARVKNYFERLGNEGGKS